MYRQAEQLEQCMVQATALVKEAARRLDEYQLGLVCVVDDTCKLLGILTNGDFRKFILRGGRLDDPVTAAMNSRPRTARKALVKRKDSRFVTSEQPVSSKKGTDANQGDYEVAAEYLASLFMQQDIRYIPMIDEDGRLTDIVYATDILQNESSSTETSLLNCDVVVMAGGKGTRLDPFTRVLPKPLIPIGDKPIIEHIMRRFASYGMRRFHISVHHMASILRAYLEERHIGYDISYLTEPSPLGTAGALYGLVDRMTEPFFVTNCDILISANYRSLYEFHVTDKHALTLVVAARQHTIPYGVCELNSSGRLQRLHEKPFYDILVNTGLYVISPSVLHYLSAQTYCDMTTLIERLLQHSESVGVFPVSADAFIDIGAWKEYRNALSRLAAFESQSADTSSSLSDL